MKLTNLIVRFFIYIIVKCNVSIEQEQVIDWSKFIYSDNSLSITNKHTLNLNGIEFYTQLTEILASFNKIESIEPIMNLRVVKKLDISDNLIKNIDSIGNLIKLEYIDLINNRMIKLLEDKNLIEDLYKDKNKINIYYFLSKVINANDKFNNDVSELDEKKIKQLRIIQSKIIYVFSSHNNYITELICLQHLIK